MQATRVIQRKEYHDILVINVPCPYDQISNVYGFEMSHVTRDTPFSERVTWLAIGHLIICRWDAAHVAVGSSTGTEEEQGGDTRM